MYQFSIAPSEYLAPSFESKLNMCDRTGCAYVEISDIVEKQFLGDMDDKKIKSIRDLLIDYGKTISLVTYTGKASDKERFQALLRAAQYLHVKAIKVGSEGYETIDAFLADIEPLAADAARFGIDICVENTHDTILAHDADMETLVANAKGNLKVIFNPFSHACMPSHLFCDSRLKNSIAFLRVNDGLVCDRKPTMPGQGDAAIRELVSHLRSRSYDGYFSFTDYFGGMCWADLMEYVAAFRTLLKNM